MVDPTATSRGVLEAFQADLVEVRRQRETLTGADLDYLLLERARFGLGVQADASGCTAGEGA